MQKQKNQLKIYICVLAIHNNNKKKKNEKTMFNPNLSDLTEIET
jgi:hypothetical protein